MATFDVLRNAAAAKKNFVVTQEPSNGSEQFRTIHFDPKEL